MDVVGNEISGIFEPVLDWFIDHDFDRVITTIGNIACLISAKKNHLMDSPRRTYISKRASHNKCYVEVEFSCFCGVVDIESSNT
jgi:hypothetical protein